MRSQPRSASRSEDESRVKRKRCYRSRSRSESPLRGERDDAGKGSGRPPRSSSPSSHTRRRRHSRSASPARRHSHRSHRDPHKAASTRHRSQSPRRQRSPARSRQPLPSQEQSYRGSNDIAVAEPPQPKEKPNFKPSGLLAAETNKVTVSGGVGKNPQSIVLKYHEPPEARKPPPSEQWVLYVFKGDSKTPLDTVQLHTRSCWLFGREAAVADVPTEHPSCSKQHAVLQFRHTMKKDEWGEKRGKIGLYVLDLESANGTLLNGEKIDAARYCQVMSGDVIKFGDSEREYVVLLPPKG